MRSCVTMGGSAHRVVLYDAKARTQTGKYDVRALAQTGKYDVRARAQAV